MNSLTGRTVITSLMDRMRWDDNPVADVPRPGHNRQGRKFSTARCSLQRKCSPHQIVNYRGANVNATNEKGWTPLHMAAAGGHPSAINTLLNRGAHINVEDISGWTLLHEAAYEAILLRLRR